jgi:hypothetical protein
MGRIKKAQTGYRADNTRVKKPIVRPSLQRVEAQEKLKIAKKLYKDNPSSSKVFSDAVDSAKARLSRAPKQRSGGKIAPKKSNVSKKLGSAKKSIGNMRFTKKKK